MKLIIDIDKDAYEEIKKIVANKNEMCFMQKSIANGTPLKVGHWIRMNDDMVKCSECGRYLYKVDEEDLAEFHAWCGRCGARMESEE